jgi:hypothetical protein
MTVYHGSDSLIRQIDLTNSKPGKDFGRGFYVTKYRRQAEDMAKRVSDWRHTQPVVTEFEFDEYAVEDTQLKTLRFDGYTKDWFDFIMLNRRNRSPKQVHDFDIVEGPVADNDITQRIFIYLRGKLTKEDFLEELKFHRPTHQICLCTTEALQTIEPVKNDLFTASTDDAITQSLIADYAITEDKAIDLYFSSEIYRRLIDEDTELYRKPWSEVYQLLLDELKLKE